MQQVKRKKKKNHPWLRWGLLGCSLVMLIGCVAAYMVLNRKAPVVVPKTETAYGELISKEPAEVAGLKVTLRGGEQWAICQDNGEVRVEDDPAFCLDSGMVDDLLDAACVVSYSETLSRDPEEYSGRLAQFGLDDPKSVVEIRYTDGSSAVLRIGNRSDELDDSFYYMLVDGYDALYALDLTTGNTLCVERALLHAVEQPVIHKARIDSFTVALKDSVLSWSLDGEITDADAEDRWFLTAPVRYPAEGESIAKLRSSLANLRLGAYVCEETPENRTAYGFDEPRMILTVHQAAGTIGTADNDGVFTGEDYPESTTVWMVGNAKNDVVDYVLYDGSIYITSHFSLDVFMSLDAANTVTRYPVRTTLSNLKTMTVADAEGTVVYTVERVEQTDDRGNLICDDDGNTQYDYSASRNDVPVSWNVFEKAYQDLLLVTVSGSLPQGWSADSPMHTLYTFTTRTGTVHTIGLTRFDALHDAVLVDDCAMFYIIHDGLRFDVQANDALAQ